MSLQKKNRWSFFLLIAIILFSSCKAILVKHVVNSYNKNKGAAFPELKLENEEGKTVTLNSLKGNVVYIDLWGTWCSPCIQDIPYLNKMKEDLDSYKDIKIVNICIKSDRDAWKNMIIEKSFWG